jgi:hypothetical protein
MRYFRSPTSAEQISVEAWHLSSTIFFSNQIAPFPYPPGKGCHISRRDCVRSSHLGVCHHDIEMLFLGSKVEELKRERLRWHPERFHARGEAQVLAQEKFALIQRLIDGPVVK